MERRSFLGALTLGVLLGGPYTEFVRAQNESQAGASAPAKTDKKSELPENSTIVLVHAAWADASSWNKSSRPSSATACQWWQCRFH